MHEWPKNKCEECDAKLKGLDNAERIFVKNPNSASSTLCNDTIYFKPTSRTFGWKACSMNGIMSVQTTLRVNDTTPKTSDEYVFVGRQEGAISTKGDSGALICELEACADGKTIALTPMAMIWGGNPDGGVVLQGFDDVTELDDCPADAHRWEFLDIQFYNGGDGQYHREVPPCISVWAELIGFVEGDLFTVLVYALSLTAFELEGCIEADYKAAIVLGEHAIGVNIAGHSLYPENVGSFGNFEGNRPIIEVGYQLGLASGYIDVYC
ncbi:hypothetical protein BcDW1_7585 [Botrytis cinerea BcDW1]|uniref:Uncharacterized protein n=1 Tax=Botryotinia fuckeliana (strain BcDW1) TaxID=1290391 RepID=M7TR93_BOTF1|nr:hypothetical protein BcDW1_7585 [Botrytis cinerea BcDW1]